YKRTTRRTNSGRGWPFRDSWERISSMNIKKKLCINFNDRRNVEPTLLVLHYTGTKTAQDAEDFFFNRHPGRPPVSAHYMVDEDGTITQYVEESDRAWHAGKAW